MKSFTYSVLITVQSSEDLLNSNTHLHISLESVKVKTLEGDKELPAAVVAYETVSVEENE